MKNKMYSCIAVICILIVSSAAGCSPSGEPHVKTGFYFNTVISLTVYDANAGSVLDEAMALCGKYEKMLSRTVEGSDIWNLNHAMGAPVQVTPETAMLLTKALEYASLTGGKIDPTVAPLEALWNFTGDPPGPVPDGGQIKQLLSHIDYRALRVEGVTAVLSDPKAQVDTGFIAKGFIADRLKELLLERGIKSAIIDLGGNVLAVGQKPDGTPFRTGIQKPFGSRGETVRVVGLSDKSLVSSGNYERYFVEDGKSYHHILDTSDGFPAQTGLAGVTILSDSSMEGDALSTACFLLGLEDGMALIESLPGVEALFITEDNAIYTTDAFPE